jgi:hypothetical protein
MRRVRLEPCDELPCFLADVFDNVLFLSRLKRHVERAHAAEDVVPRRYARRARGGLVPQDLVNVEQVREDVGRDAAVVERVFPVIKQAAGGWRHHAEPEERDSNKGGGGRGDETQHVFVCVLKMAILDTLDRSLGLVYRVGAGRVAFAVMAVALTLLWWALRGVDGRAVALVKRGAVRVDASFGKGRVAAASDLGAALALVDAGMEYERNKSRLRRALGGVDPSKFRSFVQQKLDATLRS